MPRQSPVNAVLKGNVSVVCGFFEEPEVDLEEEEIDAICAVLEGINGKEHANAVVRFMRHSKEEVPYISSPEMFAWLYVQRDTGSRLKDLSQEWKDWARRECFPQGSSAPPSNQQSPPKKQGFAAQIGGMEASGKQKQIATSQGEKLKGYLDMVDRLSGWRTCHQIVTEFQIEKKKENLVKALKTLRVRDNSSAQPTTALEHWVKNKSKKGAEKCGTDKPLYEFKVDHPEVKKLIKRYIEQVFGESDTTAQE